MTTIQQAKMQLCLAMARAIVQRYRAQAPEGFDPKMSLAVVAVVGGVAALGSAGLSYASSKKAGKDAKGAAAQAQGMYEKTGRKADSMLSKYERLLSDPRRVLAMTMNANNENFEDAKNASVRLNNFNQGELTRMLNKNIPGYQGLIGTALKNTRSWLRGQIPSDVSGAVEDRAAERATMFGLPADSTNRKALTARDLGRTSLDLMSAGESSLQRWISTARSFLTPALSNPMDFLFTPQQYTNTVLAGANVASQRAGIITGAGNASTNAYLSGAEAGIKADQAASQALAQGLESLGGIGMAYAGRKGTGGGAGMGGAPAATPGGGSNMNGFLAALGIGGTGVGMASPTTYQAYLNN
jgi:hypothetical protein